MQKKSKLLIVYNIIFYLFIILHNYYPDDNVPQVLFYIALSLSFTLFELSFREDIKEVKVYSLVDFIIRILVLVIHFLHLIFKVSLFDIIIITLILFIVNIIMEIIIVNIALEINDDKLESISQGDIDKFIKDIDGEKIKNYLIDRELKEEICRVINILKICGKSNILMGFLFLLIFVSRFIMINMPQLYIIPAVLIIFIMSILFKLFNQINSKVYGNNNKMRNYVETITFIVGYIIILCTQSIFYKKLGYFNISIQVVGILFFIPVINTRYLVRKKTEYLYKKFKAQKSL